MKYFVTVVVVLGLVASAEAWDLPVPGDYDLAGGVTGCATINGDGTGTTNTNQFGNGDTLTPCLVVISAFPPVFCFFHKVGDVHQPGTPHVANIIYVPQGNGKYSTTYTSADGRTQLGTGTWCPKPPQF